MLRWSWPVRLNFRKNCRDSRRRRQVKGARWRVVHRRWPVGRLRLEALEDRTLMSGDPFLTVALASHTIAENAGPSTWIRRKRSWST
jgi:hypothetical protein